jgi:hypothetical protein
MSDDYGHWIETADGLRAMLGKTFVRVEGRKGGDEMVFETAEGERWVFMHFQSCCESVDIEDIVGDLEDLVGEPLLVAEEVKGATPADFDDEYVESWTWTFYKFATRRGWVDVRWLGRSNGYYSERVNMCYYGVDRPLNVSQLF